MTNETLSIIVSDPANGNGNSIQVNVDKGTAIRTILEEAGVTVKEGQVISFKGAPVEPDFQVTERGLATVTANTKAA